MKEKDLPLAEPKRGKAYSTKCKGLKAVRHFKCLRNRQEASMAGIWLGGEGLVRDGHGGGQVYITYLLVGLVRSSL